jgi:type IV pilus assembly protein PilN
MIKINLLPVREERRKTVARQFLLMLAAAAVGSGVLSAAHYWWYRGQVQEAKEAAVRVQKDIDRFGPQLAQVEKFRAAKADIEKKLKVIDDLSTARSGPVHLFDEIATSLPDRMWLTKMQVEGQALTIQGVSLDNELVAAFLTSLNNSPYFKDVELVETHAKELEGYKLNQFELSAKLSGPNDDEAESTEPAAADAKQAAAGASGAALGAGR